MPSICSLATEFTVMDTEVRFDTCLTEQFSVLNSMSMFVKLLAQDVIRRKSPLL